MPTTRSKALRVPAAEPGSVVAFEYELTSHPYAMQDLWAFQSTVPVRRARYVLSLPDGWQYETKWMNAAAVEPQRAAGTIAWELTDVGRIEEEPGAPSLRAVSGTMGLTLVAPTGAGHRTWDDDARWYEGLAEPRRAVSPSIDAKAKALTASLATPYEKIAAPRPALHPRSRHRERRRAVARARGPLHVFGAALRAHRRGMLLLRPRVVGTKPEGALDLSERKQDYVTEGPSRQLDDVEIAVPANYVADELPPARKLETPAVVYSSASTFEKNTLHYRRALRSAPVRRDARQTHRAEQDLRRDPRRRADERRVQIEPVAGSWLLVTRGSRAEGSDDSRNRRQPATSNRFIGNSGRRGSVADLP
jgi:hypothetical protein